MSDEESEGSATLVATDNQISDEESEGNATLVVTDNQISVSSEYLSHLQDDLDACFDKIESLELRVEHLEINRLYLINQLERSNNTVSDLKLYVNRLESENRKLRYEFISLRNDIIHLKKDNIDLKKDNIDLRNDITHLKKDNIDLRGELKAAVDMISNQGRSIDLFMKESKKNKEKALRALVPKALREALPYVHLNRLTPNQENMLKKVRETRNSLAHLIRDDDISEVISYKLVCLKNKLSEREFQVEAKKIVGDDVLRQILTELSLVSISEEFVAQESLEQAVSDWLDV